MPQGKGTYGSKVGRPPTKKSPTTQKDHYKGENTDENKLKNLSTDQQSHLDNLNKRRKTANTENEYLKFNKGYTEAVDSIHNVINPVKPASPLEYAPFKMKAANYGNSPMRKNFGVGDSEMPIKVAPTKFGGLKNWLFGKNKGGQQPQQPQDPMAQATEAAQGTAQDTMMQQEMAGAGAAAAGGAEGGAIPPHGPESHTGGAGPIGGAEKKKGLMGLFGSNRAKAGAGAAGVASGMAGNMFSDVRLKEKIERTGASASGIPIYEFNYIGSDNRYSGAMAQDLLEINPDAVTIDTSGYYKVNYNNIDVDMHLIN